MSWLPRRGDDTSSLHKYNTTLPNKYHHPIPLPQPSVKWRIIPFQSFFNKYFGMYIHTAFTKSLPLKFKQLSWLILDDIFRIHRTFWRNKMFYCIVFFSDLRNDLIWYMSSQKWWIMDIRFMICQNVLTFQWKVLWDIVRSIHIYNDFSKFCSTYKTHKTYKEHNLLWPSLNVHLK